MTALSKEKRARGEVALQIYQALRRDILDMSLAPGVPLDEKTVAGRYAVSRSPVREAIIRLSADGLVRTLPNKSAIVSPLNIEDFPTYIDALDLMQRVTTRLAAMHRTDEELRRIKQKHRDFERARAAGDALSMIETNRDFHTAIAEAGKNRYFTMLYTRLLDEGRRTLRVYFHSLDDALPLDLALEHDGIIDAIERRDPDLAETLAHQHAEQVANRILDYLGSRNTVDFPLQQTELR